MTRPILATLLAASAVLGASGPTLPLDTQALHRLYPMMAVPCVINGRSLSCQVDTGATDDLVLPSYLETMPLYPPEQAISCQSPSGKVLVVAGTAESCGTKVALTLENLTTQMPATLVQGYVGPPLIGLKGLELHYPQGFYVDFQTNTMGGLK